MARRKAATGSGRMRGGAVVRMSWPAVGVFGLLELVSPLYSSTHVSLSLFVWKLIVVWPLGAFFTLPGALLLVEVVESRRMFQVSQSVLVLGAVIAVVVVVDGRAAGDAQAGVAYWLVSIFGLGFAAVILGFRLLERIFRPPS